MSALIWPTQAILQARSDWVTLPFFNNAKLFSLYLDGPTQWVCLYRWLWILQLVTNICVGKHRYS